MNNKKDTSKNTGFATGLFLGTVFGGASLFFFGTKTGKKVRKSIQNEFESGDLDLKKAQGVARDKIDKIIKELNLKESLSQVSKNIKTKTKKSSEKNKKFFQKKGKNLGKS